jgi:hypothetical protein
MPRGPTTVHHAIDAQRFRVEIAPHQLIGGIVVLVEFDPVPASLGLR